MEEIAKNGLSTLLKAVAAVASMVGLVYVLTAPMIISVQEQGKRLERLEQRITASIAELNAKTQVETARAENLARTNYDRNAGRIVELEEWQKWWYRTIQPIDAQQNVSIGNLEKKVYNSE